MRFDVFMGVVLWIALTGLGYGAFWEFYAHQPPEWKSDIVFSETDPRLAAQLLGAESGPENPTLTVRFIDQGYQGHRSSSPEYVTREQVESTFIGLPNGSKEQWLRLERETHPREHEFEQVLIFQPIPGFQGIDHFTLSLQKPWSSVTAQKVHVPWYQPVAIIGSAIFLIPLLAAIGIAIFLDLTSGESRSPERIKPDTVTKKSEFNMPNEWNDQLITQQILSLHQNSPNVLGYFIHSLIERFILRENDKTAEKRTELILRIVKQLKATKDLQIAIDDLMIHSLEREIRVKTTEIARDDVLDRQQKQQELQELRRQKEKLVEEVEIAKLKKEKRNYEEPKNDDEPKLSAEEIKEQRKTAIYKRMSVRKTEREQKIAEVTEGLPREKWSADLEERVVRMENMYDMADERDLEEVSKLL